MPGGVFKEQQEGPVAGVSEQGVGGRGSSVEREKDQKKDGGEEGLGLRYRCVPLAHRGPGTQ